ncbi:MAG: hypothetical protein K2W78_08100 [Xanthobacteraceae bacterium]|nr:hypothetical protein [Xanthobacteraceae bacterium]
MTSISFRRGLVAASFVLSTLTVAGSASAADLAYKAPTPPPAPTLDIHGFFDASFGGDYISPRGLHVTKTGLTSQLATGLLVDLYKNNNSFINKFTIYTGVWNDLWSEQKNTNVGSWNEFDWWVGAQVGFAKNWLLDAQYIEFLSPPGNFKTERNLSVTLSYDDTSWGLPIAIKPYVRGWYTFSGDSNVTTGKVSSGYVEFGANPTLDLKKQYGFYLVAPTWVSVGPKDFWTASSATPCGSISTPCGTSNGGVFSTGLTVFIPVTWIPKNFGNWTVRGGFQYYHLINDYLLQAQVNTGVAASYADAKRDIVVGFGGIGFNF